MPIIGGNMGFYCETIKKKLGNDVDPDPLNVHGIYQKKHGIKGCYYRRMEFYVPTNPRTELQQANRAKFAEAVLAWQALTQEQKEVYNKIAKYKQFSGYNLFIRNLCNRKHR